MRIIKPSFEILDQIDGKAMLKKIEAAARTCYKSEQNITADSALKMVSNLICRGHESALEHEKISVRIICDRGVSHEIVRHRIASYSQESTRYCNYSGERFGGEMAVIEPVFLKKGTAGYEIWKASCEAAERAYFALLDFGCSPQQARAVLPNSLKTEIVVTMNLREWRHFFFLRTANDAHPQMREISRPLLRKFRELVPVVYDGIGIDDTETIEIGGGEGVLSGNDITIKLTTPVENLASDYALTSATMAKSSVPVIKDSCEAIDVAASAIRNVIEVYRYTHPEIESNMKDILIMIEGPISELQLHAEKIKNELPQE